MSKTYYTLLCLFLTLSAFCQTTTTKDSISNVYHTLFKHLESDYLYREDINWEAIKPSILKKAATHSSLESALNEATVLFDTIGGTHCQLFSPNGWYGATPKKQLSQEDFSRNFLLKYQEQPGFEVEVLNNQYGYVLIPGMNFMNKPQDSLDANTQKIYNAITTLQDKHTIKGWIIDLRHNIGGNAYTMLTGLYHVFGDKKVMTGLNAYKKAKSQGTLRNGIYYEGDTKKTFVTPSLPPDTKIPVVLITGKMTSSAGEDIAVGFRGRDHVLVVGEESYGFLTGNSKFELPYGISAALTTGYYADQDGTYTPSIIPDVEIIKQDDFQNLLNDENIKAAIKFIDKTS